MATAYFAAGCFWSKEFFFSQQPGVVATRTGFAGGHTAAPTYHDVLTKTTGHAETVEVTFDPQQTDFTALAKFFFSIHDPTIDRRDRGGQYRSAIFCTNPEQQTTAQQLVTELQAKGYTVVTEVLPLDAFWPAEARHQGYCTTHQLQPQQHFHDRFNR